MTAAPREAPRQWPGQLLTVALTDPFPFELELSDLG